MDGILYRGNFDKYSSHRLSNMVTINQSFKYVLECIIHAPIIATIQDAVVLIEFSRSILNHTKYGSYTSHSGLYCQV